MIRARFAARAARYPVAVDVMKDVPVANDDGQAVEGASVYCRRFARVAPVGGVEAFRADADQTQADATYRLRLRYDATTKLITPQMWILLPDGTRLNITRASDVGFEHREIELECNERVA